MNSSLLCHASQWSCAFSIKYIRCHDFHEFWMIIACFSFLNILLAHKDNAHLKCTFVQRIWWSVYAGRHILLTCNFFTALYCILFMRTSECLHFSVNVQCGGVITGASDLRLRSCKFSPTNSALCDVFGQVVHTRCSVTKHYNLVLAKGKRCSAAEKETVDFASR